MGSSNDETWIYKGRAELVDLEVVISSTHEEGEERRFEILSPHGSFVLYSGKLIPTEYLDFILMFYR